ncbi:MAG: hypothetical protein HQM10_17590 [Candidatus Riflebacteria bacterium]|nr:hypothetical protein [Candidatus Riflebacteria bacterium]
MLALLIFLLAVIPLIDFFYFENMRSTLSFSSRIAALRSVEILQQFQQAAHKPGMLNIAGYNPEKVIAEFNEKLSGPSQSALAEIPIGNSGWKFPVFPTGLQNEKRVLSIKKVSDSNVFNAEIFRITCDISWKEANGIIRNYSTSMPLLLEK